MAPARSRSGVYEVAGAHANLGHALHGVLVLGDLQLVLRELLRDVDNTRPREASGAQVILQRGAQGGEVTGASGAERRGACARGKGKTECDRGEQGAKVHGAGKLAARQIGVTTETRRSGGQTEDLGENSRVMDSGKNASNGLVVC